MSEEYVNVIRDGELLSVLKSELDITHVTAEQVRKWRDSRLAETDWWASSDLVMDSDQIAYRQALRDITDQAGFPTDVTWPTKPSE